MPNHPERDKTGKVIYPYNEWEVVEENFTVENNYRNETIFSLGNGYIGMRGNFEEGYAGPEGTGLNGTYVNGFYESEYIKYGETAYGFAEKSQTMLNVTDGKIIRLFVEDEEFNMLKGGISEYERVLCLREGLLRRSLTWTSPKGRRVRLGIERLVALNNRHLAAINYRVTPLDFSGTITIVSALNGNVENLNTGNDPRVGSGLKGRVLFPEDIYAKDAFGMLVQKTKSTQLYLACAMDNTLQTGNEYSVRSESGASDIKTVFTVKAAMGREIQLAKYIAYAASAEKSEPAGVARRVLEEAKLLGFEGIKKAQKEYLDDFWFRTDIEIKGDPALQQSIRVNAFHLIQAAGKDGRTNIAAKGLTGEGYEGHYFWDTEIYVLPFFLYSFPGVSRKLLEYRYGILGKARERARQMSHEKGALFPWRTIGGEECSAYFPAGTAQYHINADIAFAIKKYVEATGDREFLIKYGAEILFETARLWADLGFFNERRGNSFCINMVTGPDEYSALVNNNCYTNLMARENLLYAFETAEWMRTHAQAEYRQLADRTGLGAEEPEYWKKAADSMFVPYDEKAGIYLQDEGFLDREKWDFENTPGEKYPLLLHFHPLVIYRHQVCKQADLVLLLYLLGDRFTKEEKKANFDFYEKLTTHDSSLSTCIFSIEASETGYRDRAYEYFMETARMDLDDTHNNTKDGIHAANMAGTWQCIVNGFAGMRVKDGTLSFAPYLPDSWEEYSFKVAFRGRLIGVGVDKNGARYELLEGAGISVMNFDECIKLASN